MVCSDDEKNAEWKISESAEKGKMDQMTCISCWYQSYFDTLHASHFVTSSKVGHSMTVSSALLSGLQGLDALSPGAGSRHQRIEVRGVVCLRLRLIGCSRSPSSTRCGWSPASNELQVSVACVSWRWTMSLSRSEEPTPT